MRMGKILTFVVIIVIGALVLTSSAAEWANNMILSFGEKLSAPQQAIMKVQLGASTQSGAESMGESVQPIIVSVNAETALFKDLLKEEEMGPLGVSAAFLRKAEAGAGIWVANSNNDFVPVVFANAFYTAGMRDIISSVSSSEPVPGMMVLGVAIGAYEKLTGTKLAVLDVKLAAEEIVLTSKLGTAIGHMEMGAEVIAYAKEFAESNKGTKAEDIARVMKERVTLYERTIDDAALKDVSEFIMRYAASGNTHSDMPVQLAALRAEQLWLVEPKERMMDAETIAQADKELGQIIQFMEKDQDKGQSFYEKNAKWLMPLGFVLSAALISVTVAYFQTRPKKGSKGAKKA
jgi:uncharacterized protein YpuA (DUF1002 family)